MRTSAIGLLCMLLLFGGVLVGCGQGDADLTDISRDDTARQEVAKTAPRTTTVSFEDIEMVYRSSPAIEQSVQHKLNRAAEAVFEASWAAGLSRLVTVGSVRIEGPGVANYLPSPDDRLAVTYADGTEAEVYIETMQGDFSGDATGFLDQDHLFSATMVEGSSWQLHVASEQMDGNIRKVAEGPLILNGVPMLVNVVMQGTISSDAGGGGVAHKIDFSTVGTAASQNMAMRFDEYTLRDFVMVDNKSALRHSRFINSSCNMADDEIAFDGVVVDRAFVNNSPSPNEPTWEVGGTVRLNGQEIGWLNDGIDGQFVKVWLQLPEGARELEADMILLQ